MSIFVWKSWPYNPYDPWRTSCVEHGVHSDMCQHISKTSHFLHFRTHGHCGAEFCRSVYPCPFSTVREHMHLSLCVSCWQQDYSESQIKSHWSKMWHLPLRCPCNDRVWKGLNAFGPSPIASEGSQMLFYVWFEFTSWLRGVGQGKGVWDCFLTIWAWDSCAFCQWDQWLLRDWTFILQMTLSWPDVDSLGLLPSALMFCLNLKKVPPPILTIKIPCKNDLRWDLRWLQITTHVIE